MVVKKKEKNEVVYLVVSAAITIFCLFFIYYVKYTNQGLNLAFFNLNSVGNVLNLIFSLLVLLGILIYFFKNYEQLQSIVILGFVVIMTTALAFAYILTKFQLPLKTVYFLGQPLQKIVTGGLFTAYQLIQIILICLLWSSSFGRGNILYFRSVINSIIIILLLFVFTFFYSASLNDKVEKEIIKKTKSNIAVVLGAAVWSNNKASPSLASRLNKAIELYRLGYIGKIQLTGSNAPGELPEAEVAYRYIRHKEINEEDILLETKTTSTTEQVSFVKFSLFDKKSAEIIIISDKYHLPRVIEICRFYDVIATPVSSDLHFSTRNNIYHRIRETIAITIFWLFAI